MIPILAFILCDYRSDNPLAPGLENIEILSAGTPDSAYTLLSTYNKSLLTTERDSAMFALLWAELRDKTFHDDTTSKLLSKAVDLFKREQDYDRLARTLFYQGRVFQNSGRLGESILCFNNALENMRTNGMLIYKAKTYCALSESNSQIGDSPQQLENSRKAWLCYLQLDSLPFIRDAQLWYGISLAENDSVDKGVMLMKEVLDAAIAENDTATILEASSRIGNALLWKKDYNSANGYFDLPQRMAIDDRMSENDRILLIYSMIKNHADPTLIKKLRQKLSDNIMEDELPHEYHLLSDDYLNAFLSLSREYDKLNFYYTDKIKSDANLLMEKDRQLRLKEADYRIWKARVQTIWIIITSLVTIISIILITRLKIERKSNKIKELLDTIGLLSKNDSKQLSERFVSSDILQNIFLRLDHLYSAYYRMPESSTSAPQLIYAMETELQALREDDTLLTQLENEINQETSGILNHTYSKMKKVSANQRRLVAYLYFGLSVEMICLLFRISPEVYYNRKSRLKKTLMELKSESALNLIDKIFN